MNDEQPSGNPWVKSLLIWGGVFLALLLAVSMFNTRTETQGAQIGYSDFRARVAGGQIESVQISETRITGKYKAGGGTFSTIPVPNDTTLQPLLQQSGVKYEGKEPEQTNMLVALLFNILPFVLFLFIRTCGNEEFAFEPLNPCKTESRSC